MLQRHSLKLKKNRCRWLEISFIIRKPGVRETEEKQPSLTRKEHQSLHSHFTGYIFFPSPHFPPSARGGPRNSLAPSPSRNGRSSRNQPPRAIPNAVVGVSWLLLPTSTAIPWARFCLLNSCRATELKQIFHSPFKFSAILGFFFPSSHWDRQKLFISLEKGERREGRSQSVLWKTSRVSIEHHCWVTSTLSNDKCWDFFPAQQRRGPPLWPLALPHSES